jgi:alpha-ketoglutarate-dependent taurine dioxygenase
MPSDWTVTPLTGYFGASLTGRRITDGFDPGWLLSTLEEHLLLVLPDQHITHAEQVALARELGEPTPAHPTTPGHPDFPEILVLEGDKGGKNARWHTDVTFMVTPPTASVLVADVVPPAGGDTLWADTRTAYDRLSEPLRRAVDGLEAVHIITPLAYWGEPADAGQQRDDALRQWSDAKKIQPVIHPVVRVHPATGRPSLFVSPGFTSHILGLSRIESDGLLALLYAHMTQPEFFVRHRYQAGDVVIWDNRATMHYATDDYGAAERKMRRVTVRGDRPVGTTGTESRIAENPFDAVR